MSETLKAAIKRAKQDDKVKELQKNGYFLNSGISILKPERLDIVDWILTFYNPLKDEVVEVLVDSVGLQIKEPAKPLKPGHKELKVDEIKTNLENMFEKAQGEFKKFKRPLSQVIITAQKEEDAIWRFNFITKTLEVATVTIDAKDGRVLSSELSSLMKT
jgi:hypothetical protein